MRGCIPLLYFDGQDHTWRFYVKDNSELVYSIMYEEDKWTKESKVDSDVLDFTVNLDRELKVYLIYSTKGGELKYCISEENQWAFKTLYRFENQDYQISELSVNTVGKYLHIFFIAKNIGKKVKCSLIHFCLHDEEKLFNTIYNISFMQEAYSHYQIEVLKNGSINLLLIHKQENEVAIKLIEYKNQKWSNPRRLYGINGSNINFCTIKYNDMVNILNLSKESSTYSLEHVLIGPDGKMNSSKIHEGSIEFKNYLLLEISRVLWAMWSEDEKFFASYYIGKWSEPVLYGDEINETILLYKYLSINNKYKNIKSKYMLGTMPPEIKLLLPDHKNTEHAENSLENSGKDESNSLEYIEEKNSNLDDELTQLKKSNKILEKRVIDLQLQLQQRKRIIDDSEENFIRLTNAKKKAEEKLNLIAEVQQISKKELEEIRKQKILREDVHDEFKKKLQELTSENEQLEKKIEANKNQKQAKDKVIEELKNKINQLTSENDQLKIELKYENNKGIMDRILKKKLDR